MHSKEYYLQECGLCGLSFGSGAIFAYSGSVEEWPSLLLFTKERTNCSGQQQGREENYGPAVNDSSNSEQFESKLNG